MSGGIKFSTSSYIRLPLADLIDKGAVFTVVLQLKILDTCATNYTPLIQRIRNEITTKFTVFALYLGELRSGYYDLGVTINNQSSLIGGLQQSTFSVLVLTCLGMKEDNTVFCQLIINNVVVMPYTRIVGATAASQQSADLDQMFIGSPVCSFQGKVRLAGIYQGSGIYVATSGNCQERL